LREDGLADVARRVRGVLHEVDAGGVGQRAGERAEARASVVG
jgi:hypothetical protein